MKTPNYVLTEKFSFSANGAFGSAIELPEGTFVRPIEVIWLPTHILQSSDYKFFKPEKEVFVYTRYGIIVVPRDIIRKV